ncbi:MAG: hypothetical protein IAG13_05490 [Deltaproteobacteria bacterium]|nr:hypothetical protein [Nannocystaceae bacterium]
METYDVEQRIAQLEAELGELRAARPKAERPRALPTPERRRRWSTVLALSLFATSLPVATWLHIGAREEATQAARKSEQRHERNLQLAAYRQERTMRFVDAALDEDASVAEREVALRFLAEELGDKSLVRKWARKQLKRVKVEPAASSSPCDGRRNWHP